MPAIPPAPTATLSAVIYLYRCDAGDHGRGGRRTLIGVTRKATIDVGALSATLSAGRYRLEGRTARGRVVRVRMLNVRPADR